MGLPFRDSRILAYNPISSHFFSHLGSFCGRLAFMGKSPEGRFKVDLGSSGGRMISPVKKSGMNNHYNQLLSCACCTCGDKQGCMRAGSYIRMAKEIYSVFTSQFCRW